jgi:hypothetical protein
MTAACATFGKRLGDGAARQPATEHSHRWLVEAVQAVVCHAGQFHQVMTLPVDAIDNTLASLQFPSIGRS